MSPRTKRRSARTRPVKAAGKLRRSFSRQALPALDRALLLLERNVNQKILFTDLVNRLYMTTL